MTGIFLLDWATMAVSLFNTIALLWLGLTVLLNAERRTWGIWLAGGGLLMSCAFFISHSAILGTGLGFTSQGLDFWWHVGWVPVVISPFAWYVVMLWYAGFWDDKRSNLRRRQSPWLFFTLLLTVGLIGLLIFANPLPSFWQVAQLNLSATPSIGGIPLLILVYPIYMVLCIVLSLDALVRPEPSGRVMGDLARQRARPWLVGTSAALLLVSLLVTWVMIWIITSARRLSGLKPDMALTVAWFDLIIASLIAVAIILQGQAVVAYEIFTGKALPRRGLKRHWRSAVILATGYGVMVGWGLALQLRPIYSILLTTILMTIFYALFSWRSYAERDRFIEHLRPFVASQRLYEHLLTPSPSAPSEVDPATPFRALCEDILETRLAYLVALGPLAPLVGPALTYPNEHSSRPPTLTEITDQFTSPQTMCLPLDPNKHNGAMWAIPLWSERGLIGALLLGEKRDGGLYTQEEIEIARASGERLIDTQASAEMARRLMALQRQQLAESQILDRQTRRVLHDDILPQLHTAMLNLSNSKRDDDSSSDTIESLADLHRQISNLLRKMPTTAAPQVSHMGLINALRKMVDEELEETFDEVTWQVQADAEQEIQTIPSLTGEVLFYAAREVMRNAARYGRGEDPSRPLHLHIEVAWHTHDGLEIGIKDDGVGLVSDEGAHGGSGQGLALHSTMMAVVGGTLSVESTPNAYTRVRLTLPKW